MVTTSQALRAVAGKEAGGKVGLAIDRHFTTPDAHPYDEIEWELRDAIIQDFKTGGTAFEQRGVEFPKSWSMNATTIVAQKYFRGPLGSPQREHSVRQMIDRVADTITEWGRKDGYFADDESAEVFNLELKHLLVTQKAAFNSPVWFNVGVDGRTPQCSACFILSVEDTMSSILNWYVEEGTIFKGGSGAGVNLSRIRSSKEQLKGGGTASGPVSFMRGADASAGTIKSGGTTRRAAKMVILDVDHPDIEEFIWCKQREEAKARALREAGFDMDLDGLDSASIQYQNANNSVRVTDEFMQAVEADDEFGLKAVLSGEPVETMRAKDLMRQIAQAAWECADPGVQYDTTINDWHTTPNAGRINGSNPCSEYMHLDNSACNLASLNLRKFEAGGVFDVESFKRAVEVVFSAQEIIVGNSSYPTEAIAENARAYRQLGLGYANLGGLLMSQGLAYDSDEGRAWAAAITALMTGHAYRTSAELAKVQGPFDGYAQDRDGTLRVIAKHGEKVDDIDPELAPPNILEAARQSWTDALMLGTEHGIRNAQATVLAPTGCLVGGSLVATDRGLVRLQSLGDPTGPQWQDLGIQVATDEGPREATKFYVNGLESVVTVDTTHGYRIQGTPRHRVKVVQPDGQWAWKRFSEVSADDIVPLALDQLVGAPRTVALPPGPDGSPGEMTPELAELVGYFIGNGSLHATGIGLSVAADDFDVVERLQLLGKELFGLEAHVQYHVDPHVDPQGEHVEVAFQSVGLAQWWEACGFAQRESRQGHAGKGWTPRVPDAVLSSNDRAVYSALLRGLFEADGTVTSGSPHWSTTSLAFGHEVQTVLLALGYPTARTMDTTGRGQSDVAVLRLLDSGDHDRWVEQIGFMGARKNAAVAPRASQQSARHDKVPMAVELIERVAAGNDRLRRNALQERGRSGMVSRTVARQLHEHSHDPELGRLLGFFYDSVSSAELGEDELTYDLSVPDNVTYVANGFVSHNTIGLMMDCDTTGIEPDLALVKAKKLVGGGTMRIVNQTVPVALHHLGYQPEQIEAIIAYIDEHGTIEGAPAFRDEHLPVFDCAMGERSISAMGHVKMMGAVQPFISGAISKCVVGETLVTTGDGLVRIGSLHRGEEPDSFRDEIIEVASLGGTAKTDAFYYGGVRKVRKLVLDSGHTVTGTENHRVLVATHEGLAWRYIDEIAPGEYVATQYGTDLWSPLPARFDEFARSSRSGAGSHRVPEEMTEELALLLGAYVAEGHTARSTWTVTITNPVESVLERIRDAWRSQFGLEAVIDRQPGTDPAVKVTSETVVEFLEHLGCGAGAAAERIPDAVLRSPRAMVLAFLQGLHLDADASVTQRPELALRVDSPGLLDDYQAILTNLGIVHTRVSRSNRDNETAAEVCATGHHAARLAQLVPFLEPEKAARAARLSSVVSPDVTAAQQPDWLPQGLADGLHFSPVASVEDAGEREVFDVSVPVTHAFVGNGIVNHNTVNLPESASVEHVEEMFIEGWKLGLKAIAIYRDNCKVAQPLSLSSKSKDAAGAATAEQAEAAGMVRRRLPKQRPSQTISFQVGDAEGYLTAGEYPGDGLGEIFVKLGKQGSTLSGVMDAFAISVSLGLQYGVPLEAYVKKFTNMRFDPAGMTDDPEVKFASSIVDYIFRRLAIEYLPAEKRHELGIYTIEERNAQFESGGAYGSAAGAPPEPPADAEGQTVLPIERPKPVDDTHGDAPMCYQCGVTMIRAGSCHCCPQCGTTSGCS